MSILSANTLFHFTDKKALLSILETGFRPTYSEEFGIGEGFGNHPIHIPMVCFCDIPLSMLDKHLNGHSWDFEGKQQSHKGYGRYGLGMSKRWGIEMMLNPVSYMTRESLFHFGVSEGNLILGKEGQQFYHFVHELSQRQTSLSPDEIVTLKNFVDQFRKALFHSSTVRAFTKPYQSAKTGLRYYDEKEWRYVPFYEQMNEFQTQDIKIPVAHERMPDFDSYIDHFKDWIQKKNMLGFEPHDINYIIVENDDDISDVVQQLKKIGDEHPTVYTSDQIDRLTSRILTSEQIRNDF